MNCTALQKYCAVSLVALVCLFAWAVDAVCAEDYLTPLKSGPWKGGSVDHSGNAQADYCQLSAHNSKGFSIILLWMRQGLLLGIDDESISVKNNKPYPGRLTIKPYYNKEVSLEGFAPSTMGLHIQEDKQIITALQKGAAMHLYASDVGAWSTPLTGIGEAIEALRHCYQTEVRQKAPTKRRSPPPAAINLVLTKKAFQPGEQIDISFSGLPAKGQDWLAVSASSHKPDEYYEMALLEGRPRSGRHSFKGLPEGEYEVRVYTNWPDNGYAVAKRIPLSVSSSVPAAKAAVPTTRDAPAAPAASAPSPVESEPKKTRPTMSALEMARLMDAIEQELPHEDERSGEFNRIFNQAFKHLTPADAVNLAAACHNEASKYLLAAEETDSLYPLSIAHVYSAAAVALAPFQTAHLIQAAQIQAARPDNIAALLDAETLLTQALEIDSRNGEARLALVRVILLQDEPALAAEAMEPLLAEGNPIVASPAVLELAARIYDMAGEIDRGIKAFDSLIARYPRLDPARLIQAALLHASGKNGQALEVLAPVLNSPHPELRKKAEILSRECRS